MAEIVDQLLPDGTLCQAQDERMSRRDKVEALRAWLPGTEALRVGDVDGVVWGQHLLLYKQVTHLGHPWPPHKKRIQIPGTWKTAYNEGVREGLDVRFCGIYRFNDVVLFVDFEAEPYALRTANNSAAHVMTNDLYQGLLGGVFTRHDARGNTLTVCRPDRLASYLEGEAKTQESALSVFEAFNRDFLTGEVVPWDRAIPEMVDAQWPDAYQGEWPGFYLEYRLDSFVRRHGYEDLVRFQKMKAAGDLDYDLVINGGSGERHFADLKASNDGAKEAPGNDAEDLRACIDTFGRFWYVIYSHATWHSRDDGDAAVRAWNRWKQSVGYFDRARKAFDELSYARRFKAAVQFNSMMVLEVNPVNYNLVLSDFHQGHQPGGQARRPKVMIRKNDIDNFVVFSTPGALYTKPTVDFQWQI